MLRRIFSLLLVCLFLPIVAADVFIVPGCDNIVKIGVNAIEPINLYSDNCTKISDRRYDCVCTDSRIDLYSKDKIKEYDLIIEYTDNGIEKRQRYDDYVFTKNYSSDFLNLVLFIIIVIVISVLLIPSILIYNAIKSDEK